MYDAIGGFGGRKGQCKEGWESRLHGEVRRKYSCLEAGELGAGKAAKGYDATNK